MQIRPGAILLHPVEQALVVQYEVRHRAHATPGCACRSFQTLAGRADLAGAVANHVCRCKSWMRRAPWSTLHRQKRSGCWALLACCLDRAPLPAAALRCLAMTRWRSSAPCASFRISIKALSDKSDLAALAAEIVKQCKLIHPSKVRPAQHAGLRGSRPTPLTRAEANSMPPVMVSQGWRLSCCGHAGYQCGSVAGAAAGTQPASGAGCTPATGRCQAASHAGSTQTAARPSHVGTIGCSQLTQQQQPGQGTGAAQAAAAAATAAAAAAAASSPAQGTAARGNFHQCGGKHRGTCNAAQHCDNTLLIPRSCLLWSASPSLTPTAPLPSIHACLPRQRRNKVRRPHDMLCCPPPARWRRPQNRPGWLIWTCTWRRCTTMRSRARLRGRQQSRSCSGSQSTCRQGGGRQGCRGDATLCMQLPCSCELLPGCCSCLGLCQRLTVSHALHAPCRRCWATPACCRCWREC